MFSIRSGSPVLIIQLTLWIITAPKRILGVIKKRSCARLSHTLLKRTVHESRPPAMTGWRGWRQKQAMDRLSYISLCT